MQNQLAASVVRTIKVPAYYSHHWERNGNPSGVWSMGETRPKPENIREGFFVVYHPEQELQIEDIFVVTERLHGAAYRIEEYKPPKTKKKWWEIWK